MSRDVIQLWLDELYGSPMLDDLWLSVCWRADGRMASTHVPVSESYTAAAKLSELSASTCTWLGCTPLTERPQRGRGGSDLAGAVVGMWADLDVAGPGHKQSTEGLPLPASRSEAWAVLDSVGLPPTAVIDSGGGLQVHWLMHEPWLLEGACDRYEAGAMVSAWGATMQELGRRAGVHVDNVGDLARILRPAGTWNRKADREPAAVTIVELGGPRYHLSDLSDALLPLQLPPSEKPSGQRYRQGTDLRLSPADTFSRNVTWEQLLEPHGWKRYRDSSGHPAVGGRCPSCGQEVELWSHPDVPLRNGRPDHSSASCCHVLYSFSQSLRSTKLPALTPLTPFRVWAQLDCGGDMSEAARLIMRAARTEAGKR